MKKFIMSIWALILGACTSTVIDYSATTENVSVAKAVHVQQLFSDDIERDSLHSNSNNFYTDSMLYLKPLSNTSFQVTNFTPLGFRNVTITLQLSGLTNPFKVLTIDSIEPHTRLVFEYPLNSEYESMDGKVVSIDAQRGFPASATKLDFLADSEKLSMLKGIKVHWYVHFNDYSKQQPSHPGWEPIRPAQARLYTALLLNNTYLFSQDDYRERFLKEKFYHNMNDSSRAVADSDWFIQEETDSLYYRDLMHHRLDIGIVNGYGLGGGTTLGIDNSTLTGQFYYSYDDSLMTMDYFPESYYGGPHPLFSHELGHALGYGHNSNVCSTGRMSAPGTPGWSKMFGFPSLNNLMYAKYLHERKLPLIMEEYYRQDDFSYQQLAHGSAW